MDSIEKFAELLENSRRIVFFGGAGVSTESGLKDYRSPDGIYHTAINYGRPPEQILSHDCFFEAPDIFYRFFREFFMEEAEPNVTHRCLAELERQGKDVAVVTQNIDGLHQKAGSTTVYELHGTTSRFHCPVCHREYSMDYLRTNEETVPRCVCGAIIKPDVVLYGEPLDAEVTEQAIQAIAAADLMIIGGTSLAVYPAAGLVRYFRGENLVIINKESTAYDSRASLVFHEGIGKIFQEAMSRLRG